MTALAGYALATFEDDSKLNSGRLLILRCACLFVFFSNVALLSDQIRLTIMTAVGLVAAAMQASREVQNRHARISPALIGAILVVAGIGVHAGTYPPLTDYGRIKLPYTIAIVILFGYVLPAAAYNAAGIARLSKYLAVTGFAFSLVSLGFRDSSSRRGLDGLNPSLLAKACLLLAVWQLARWLGRTSSVREFGATGLAVVAALLTGTRGPVLALVFAVLTIGLLERRFHRLVRVCGRIFVLVLLVAFALYYLPNELSDRFSTEAISISANSDEGDRIDLYQTAVAQIADRPFGIGLGNFELEHRFIKAPHNIFLEIGVELGVIAAVLFAVLILKTISKTAHLLRTHKSTTTYWLSLMFFYQLYNALIGGELSLASSLLYASTSLIWIYSRNTTQGAHHPPNARGLGSLDRLRQQASQPHRRNTRDIHPV